MRNSLRPGVWLGLLLSPVVAGGSVPEAVRPELVVAVDTSTSLTERELQEAKVRLFEIAEALDPALRGRAGVIGFADEVTWVREVTAAGEQPTLAGALGEMERTGRHTVFYDSLVVAASAMEGGVVLVASDGRDDNSVTTLLDVANRCVERSVVLVSVGFGRSIDERTLRRLALLTGGAYLGPLPEADPALVARYVSRAAKTAAAFVGGKGLREIVQSLLARIDALERRETGPTAAELDALRGRLEELERTNLELRDELEVAKASLETPPAPDAQIRPLETAGNLVSEAAPSRGRKVAADADKELAPPVETIGNLLDDAVRWGDFPRSFQIPNTEISLRVAGNMKLDTVVADPEGGDTATELSAETSRFSLFAQAPTARGRAGSFVEANFSGGTLRLRHAYAQWAGLLAGQTWSTFSHVGALPQSLTADPAGSITLRRPQLRWAASRDAVRYAVALENTNPLLLLTSERRVRSVIPDLAGHVGLNRPRLDFQLAGLLRFLEYEGPVGGDEATAYAVSASGKASIGQRDNAVFGVLYGEGAADLLAGFRGQSAAALETPGGRLETLRARGAYVGYQHFWGEHWRFNVASSFATLDDDPLWQGIQERHSTVLNLIWNPAAGVGLGAEFLRALREDTAGVETEDRLFQFSFQVGY